MYCKRCGKVNVPQAKFCCECGAQLPVASNEAASQEKTAASQKNTVNTQAGAQGVASAGTPAGASTAAPAQAQGTPANSNTPVQNPVYGSQNPPQGNPAPNPRVIAIPQPTEEYYYKRRRKPSPPNVAGIIISSLLLIACFIPFISIDYGFYEQKISFVTAGFGVIVASGAIVGIVFSVLNMKWGLIGPGLGSIACFILQIIITAGAYSVYGNFGKLIGDIVHLKLGFFAVPILSVILIICGTAIQTEYEYIKVSRNTMGYGGSPNDEFIRKLNDHGSESNCWICFNCGCQNALYVGTCKCGTNKMDKRNIVIGARSSIGYRSTTAKCPTCGRVVVGNQTICYDCGTRLIR